MHCEWLNLLGGRAPGNAKEVNRIDASGEDPYPPHTLAGASSGYFQVRPDTSPSQVYVW